MEIINCEENRLWEVSEKKTVQFRFTQPNSVCINAAFIRVR